MFFECATSEDICRFHFLPPFVFGVQRVYFRCCYSGAHTGAPLHRYLRCFNAFVGAGPVCPPASEMILDYANMSSKLTFLQCNHCMRSLNHLPISPLIHLHVIIMKIRMGGVHIEGSRCI